MSRKPSVPGRADDVLPSDCQAEILGVTFFDLSRLSEWSSSEEDERVAAFFQRFYVLAAAEIESAGGRIVKFMGDAGLAVFPVDASEKVIFALCAFAEKARQLGRELSNRLRDFAQAT